MTSLHRSDGRPLHYGALVIATAGQFAAWFCSGLIDAIAIPCCENPTPGVPSWYALAATPIRVAVYLVPGFLCGLLVRTRPVIVGALAGGLGTYLSHLFGSYLRAVVLPEWGIGGMGQAQNIWYLLTSVQFNFTVLVTSLCYAAIAAAAASAGVLARGRFRAAPASTPTSR